MWSSPLRVIFVFIGLCLAVACSQAQERAPQFQVDASWPKALPNQWILGQVAGIATRGTGSVYDLVFSPEREQRFIYMIDGMNGEVRIVDRASKRILSRFGRPGRQAGEFTALHNIAVDRQGNIYTAEVNTGQRVQKFRRVDSQE